MTDWRVTSRLFASGDRKIELVHVADKLPDPDQIAAIYTKMALLFGQAKQEPGNEDAQVHRLEIIVAPEIEPTQEGRHDQ